MRTLRQALLALLVLALPAVAAAQDTGAVDQEATPRVQLEQTTDAAPAAPALDPVEAGAEQNVESQTATADDAAIAQDPSSRQFWYIVLAVVIGGVILAVLL